MIHSRRLLQAALAVVTLALTCCATAPAVEEPEYHPDDTKAPAGFKLDKNELLTDEELQDITHVVPDEIQEALVHTRYKHESFLATYSSGGRRAADSIARAALAHRINPKVLIVLSQLVGQLVSARDYPLPAARVEYLFSCGCDRGRCDQASGGFDAQIECAAAHLGDAMQRTSDGEPTAHGFAVATESRTDDGVVVRPKNAATAALYDFVGNASEAHGGAWLFALLWNKDGWL